MINGIIPKKTFKSSLEIPVLKSNNYFLEVGDNLVINFLNDLSKNILKTLIFKKEPSFVALGFWLRKTNIKRILSENSYLNSDIFVAKPIGKVFHLCPSNVDTMFVYSLVLALLAGNKNVVRISSKLDDNLIFTLFELLNIMLQKDEYKTLLDYINVITYLHSNKLNEEISIKVNGRIIWGGDETVRQFKKYATKPKTKDLFFTDKVSLSLINIKNEEDFSANFEDISRSLYNDIYTFNQKGCSSPHCLFLVGENINKKAILERIYKKLSEIATSNYEEDISSIASLKLNQSSIDIIEGRVSKILNTSNYITFSRLNSKEIPHSCGAGYLYYELLNSVNEIIPFVSDKTQTITYWGMEKTEIRSFINEVNVEMIDRIVPLGYALDFDYIWDGYNIFMEMISFKSIK